MVFCFVVIHDRRREESQPDGQPLAETQTVIDPTSVSSSTVGIFCTEFCLLLLTKSLSWAKSLFGFFCYILQKNQNKLIGQPSTLKRYYCSMGWGWGMRSCFLTSNFQKLSGTQTAVEKVHHKKKKYCGEFWGRQWKWHVEDIFGYFSPIKSWVDTTENFFISIR